MEMVFEQSLGQRAIAGTELEDGVGVLEAGVREQLADSPVLMDGLEVLDAADAVIDRCDGPLGGQVARISPGLLKGPRVAHVALARCT